ncbi:MAG: hypothetical protein LBD89_00255 [Tannerellaceae bacterium]|jgi:hypothetical protein|nr:hypothetical protein [Tannerellaceae bacterium]
MKHYLALALLAGLLMSCRATGFETAVRDAADRQLSVYPESTLRDLYKNFFQDRFGPGHLISDTAAAGNYLRKELASYTRMEGAMAEPTGWEGNFYRVNLSVIKMGLVPYSVYFDAFVRSVNGHRGPSLKEWKRQWEAIEAILRPVYAGLPGYEQDRKAIEENLRRGVYQGDHSERFEAHYAPHYRILAREIYEKEILPFLGASQADQPRGGTAE